MFKRRFTSPPKASSDEVLPVHNWDDTTLFHSVVLYYFMRIDDALDVEKLHAAIVKLRERVS